MSSRYGMTSWKVLLGSACLMVACSLNAFSVDGKNYAGSEMYRNFKRHFSAGPAGAQPLEPPLGYLGGGDVARCLHCVSPLGEPVASAGKPRAARPGIRRWRKALGFLAGVFASTSSVEAAPIQSVYREYYNNASFGTAVGGRWVLKCSGPNNQQVWGRTSNYYVQTTSPCIGTQPPIELCYSDSFLIPCSSIPWR